MVYMENSRYEVYGSQSQSELDRVQTQLNNFLGKVNSEVFYFESVRIPYLAAKEILNNQSTIKEIEFMYNQNTFKTTKKLYNGKGKNKKYIGTETNDSTKWITMAPDYFDSLNNKNPINSWSMVRNRIKLYDKMKEILQEKSNGGNFNYNIVVYSVLEPIVGPSGA